MKTIYELTKMYENETSRFKKVHIYAAIKKLEKQKKTDSLEKDILSVMDNMAKDVKQK